MYTRPSRSRALTDPYRNYLLKEIEKTCYRLPSAVSLFKQIQNMGYQGSLRTVHYFLSEMQKGKPYPKTCFSFHKQYAIERIRKTPPGKRVVGELLKEIQAKGYRGTVHPIYRLCKDMRRASAHPEAFLKFHRGYLIERMRETRPCFASSSVLLREIQAKGYQGSLPNLQRFLSEVRKGLLLEEIDAQGYRGALKNVRECLENIQNSGPKRPSILQQHKDYLIKRLEESQLYDVSVLTLFKEIQARGYRGSLSTVRDFIAPIRRGKRPEQFGLNFHKNYLTKRIREHHTPPISGAQLFEEIRAKGYRGSIKTMQGFATKIRKEHRPQEAFLPFHKEYLAKRIEAARPHVLKKRDLFKEIQARGYLGTMQSVHAFLQTIRS